MPSNLIYLIYYALCNHPFPLRLSLCYRMRVRLTGFWMSTESLSRSNNLTQCFVVLQGPSRENPELVVSPWVFLIKSRSERIPDAKGLNRLFVPDDVSLGPLWCAETAIPCPIRGQTMIAAYHPGALEWGRCCFVQVYWHAMCLIIGWLTLQPVSNRLICSRFSRRDSIAPSPRGQPNGN